MAGDARWEALKTAVAETQATKRVTINLFSR
jgi:hypothetical protein